MIEKEINKTALMDVIEYELNWRDQAHKAEIEEKNKEILAKEEEIHKIDEKLHKIDEKLHNIKEENAKLKAILIENGISF